MKAREWRQPSWSCVHFISQKEWQAAEENVSSPQIFLAELDGSAIQSKDQLLRLLGNALGFPAYFGVNWDALEECLRDLDWISEPSSIVLVLHRGRLLFDALYPEVGTLIEIWLAAAATWSQQQVALHLVFVE